LAQEDTLYNDEETHDKEYRYKRDFVTEGNYGSGEEDLSGSVMNHEWMKEGREEDHQRNG